MTDAGPAARWRDLAELTAALHDDWLADREAAIFFAAALRAELAQYLGCPDESHVRLYAYKPGPVPAADGFADAPDAPSAVSADANGYWRFGLGVALTRLNMSAPRFEFRWGMRVRRGSPYAVEVGLGGARVDAPCAGQTLSLEPVCAAIYEGLRRVLIDTVQAGEDESRIGFVVQPD